METKWTIRKSGMMIMKGSEPIAAIYGPDNDPETIKNAHNIVAAQELLEALKNLLMMPDLNEDVLDAHTIEAIQQAQDAIAKAEGQ